MLTYTIELIEGRNSHGSKTLHVEGRVESWQKERLKGFIIDALYNSDHLILDITKVEELPPHFRDLICYIRNTAKHLGKRFIVRGYTKNKFQPHGGKPVTLKAISEKKAK